MLSPITSGLWGVEYDHYMPFRILFRTRMVVVELEDGLLLHSPVPIDDALAGDLAAKGPVRWIVAPNLFHHSYLQDAVRRYPEARVIGCAGFDSKRPELTFDRVVTPGTESADEWSGELEVIVVDGAPGLNELVFFHPGSRTLICTDLVFNVQREGTNWLSRLVFRLVGAWGGLSQSRLFASQVKDPHGYWRSMDAMLSWPFETLIMAHGAVVEENAKERLTAALEKRMKRPLSALPANAKAAS